jgi:hypothetical protein
MQIQLMVKCNDLDMQLENKIAQYSEDIQERFREQFYKFIEYSELLRVNLPEEGTPTLERVSS